MSTLPASPSTHVHIRAEQAPTFNLPGLSFTGLAAPSRGARECSVWRLQIAPGTPGAPHSLDREEIFVALAGCALCTLGTEEVELRAGDALIVPAGQAFSLANLGGEPFEAVAVARVGVQATMPEGGSFAPPWTE
jgi:mannose-6-phosphate isomerase-like protein (cupin superfamily)